MVTETEVVVLGGGAAGLMCAIAAGQRGRCVQVLDGSNRIGKKILMSGGGRCNFTNLNTQPEHFQSANPHFCKSALSRYRPEDFVGLVEAHSIQYHEKTVGQLFCNDSSKQIVAMLQSECDKFGVEISTRCEITAVEAQEDRYRVYSDHGDFLCESLVIATGGLSIPKMGASDFGFRLATQMGLKVRPTRAGLVPFTFSDPLKRMLARLAGVSTSVSISCGEARFDDDLLFTHRGLSGPAALQLSNHWQSSQDIAIDFLPNQSIASLLTAAKQTQPKTLLRTLLAHHLPKALVIELQTLVWPQQTDLPLAGFPDQQLRAIAQTLSDWSLRPSGTEGYRTAEVTLGGVDTDALSSTTMECHQFPGLYFIGEVVDVTGQLGGFNFQWAWASGQAAGNAV